MRRIVIIIAFFVVSLPMFSADHAASSDQWPMYQANASHTGYMPVSLDPAKFHLRWKKSVSTASLNPVTAAQGLVFISDLSSEHKTLYVLDASSGDTKWTNDFGSRYSVTPLVIIMKMFTFKPTILKPALT